MEKISLFPASKYAPKKYYSKCCGAFIGDWEADNPVCSICDKPCELEKPDDKQA